jgi:hypothetical protein
VNDGLGGPSIQLDDFDNAEAFAGDHNGSENLNGTVVK